MWFLHCVICFQFRRQIVLLRGDKVAGHLANLTFVVSSEYERLKLGSRSIVKLLCAVVRRAGVSTANPKTPGPHSSTFLVADNDWYGG